jgi:hypothetical protein
MKQVTAAFLFVFISLASIANAQTDFSGTWKFDDQESISGNLYSNGSPTAYTIKQDGDVFTITTMSMGVDGKEFGSTLTLSLGEKSTDFKGTSSDKIEKLFSFTLTKLADNSGYKIVFERFPTVEKKNPEKKVTDIWTIEDGKLVLVRKDENFVNGETWESKAWYEKQ